MMKKSNIVLNTIFHYKKLIVFILILIFIGLVFTNFSPFIFGMIIDSIIDRNLYGVKYCIIIGIFINIMANLISSIEEFCGNNVVWNCTNELKSYIFQHILYMKAKYLDKFTFGELNGRLEGDVSIAVNFYIEAITNIVKIIINATISFIMLISISKKLTIISLILLPSMLLVNLAFRNPVRRLDILYKEENEKYCTFVFDVINSVVFLKCFSLEKNISKKYKKNIVDLLKINQKNFIVCTVARQIKGIFTIFFDMLIIYVAAKNIISGVLSVGLLVSFNTYLGNFFDAISNIFTLGLEKNKTEISIRRIMDICNAEFENYNCNLSERLIINSIRVNNLDFSYDDKKMVISNMSFDIKEPGLYTFVGRNGSGKTTLFKLFLKLYDVKKNSIFFNETDINNISFSTVRNSIAYVAKETVILRDTIKNNICLTDDIISDSKIWEIINKVGLTSYVKELKQGLYTIIDSNMLSSGQKQKIGLARALAKERQLLLLDEVTSDLDKASEWDLLMVIKKISERSIVISINHRNAPIEISDKIIEFKCF